MGEQLRVLRERREMTVRDVEHASGLSFQYVSSLENGGGNPTLAALGSIAKAIDASIEIDITAKEDAARWDAAVSRLTADQRARLVRMAELMPALSLDLVDGVILSFEARAKAT